jgi:hypothetical protein
MTNGAARIFAIAACWFGACHTDAAVQVDAAIDSTYLGRLCELPVDADSGVPGSGIVHTPALECAWRVCLFPAAELPTNTGALCTKPCTNDEDCAGGTLADPSSSIDPHCKTGFACGVATTVGPSCCRKWCICRDFVDVPIGGLATPAACLGDGGSPTCQNL